MLARLSRQSLSAVASLRYASKAVVLSSCTKPQWSQRTNLQTTIREYAICAQLDPVIDEKIFKREDNKRSKRKSKGFLTRKRYTEPGTSTVEKTLDKKISTQSGQEFPNTTALSLLQQLHKATTPKAVLEIYEKQLKHDMPNPQVTAFAMRRLYDHSNAFAFWKRIPTFQELLKDCSTLNFTSLMDVARVAPAAAKFCPSNTKLTIHLLNEIPKLAQQYKAKKYRSAKQKQFTADAIPWIARWATAYPTLTNGEFVRSLATFAVPFVTLMRPVCVSNMAATCSIWLGKPYVFMHEKESTGMLGSTSQVPNTDIYHHLANDKHVQKTLSSLNTLLAVQATRTLHTYADSEFRRIVRAFSLSEVKHKGFWEAVDSEILSRKRKNELSPRAFLNVLIHFARKGRTSPVLFPQLDSIAASLVHEMNSEQLEELCWAAGEISRNTGSALLNRIKPVLMEKSRDFQPKQVCTVARAYFVSATPAASLFGEFSVHANHNFGNYNHRDLVCLLWASARMHFLKDPSTGALADMQTLLISREQKAFYHKAAHFLMTSADKLNGIDTAIACWSLSLLGVKDSRVYASLAARGADIIHEMDPHSMALLAYALAKNGHFAMAYQTSFISMVERLGPNAFTYNSLVHIVTAWAWSRVRHMYWLEIQPLLESIADHIVKKKLLRKGTVHDASYIMWAYSILRCKHLRLLKAVDNYCVAHTDDMESVDYYRVLGGMLHQDYTSSQLLHYVKEEPYL